MSALVPGAGTQPPGLQQLLGRPLSPTETVPALGMGMGMMQPMIPQLRQARDQLHALSPAEQDEVADALAQEVRELSADERAALMEHLDTGFFPARVSAGVKSRLAAPAR